MGRTIDKSSIHYVDFYSPSNSVFFVEDRKKFDLKESLSTSNYEKEDKLLYHPSDTLDNKRANDDVSGVGDKPIYIPKPTTAQSLINKYVYEEDCEIKLSCVSTLQHRRKVSSKKKDDLLQESKTDAFKQQQTRKKDVQKDIVIKRPFVCNELGCEKSYVKAQSLMIHKRSHTGEKPYVCTIKDCGKRYSRLDSMKDHVRTHEGKLYKCDIPGCDKSYYYSSHYLRHRKIHFVEKIYKQKQKIVVKRHKCIVPKCEKAYEFANGLTRHMYSHSKEKFKCDYPGCTKKFTYPEDIKRHKKTHGVISLHRDEPRCNESFNRSSNLADH
ncbi:13066_t:CDS:2 [Funneliformis geosporum]|uniref:13248_t:CDS:1 n=1 Tax=Funneliformis geosporum TaxID=1117311 RepID=A0A9W4SHZ8_9GLOM|nr:13248_t:CDS:2 [Funneliformis geosporum]CAI2181218.1 13066_t:CDS:2 [Funneliformis geosporum]